MSHYRTPLHTARVTLSVLMPVFNEKQTVEAAMRRCGGDKREAAALLGIALKTLYNKLDRFGLRPAREMFQ